MGHSEDVLRLRQRVHDAFMAGMVGDDESRGRFEMTLLQIVNDAERSRQTCANQAEAYRRQATMADGQAAGLAQVGSLVMNVLEGMMRAEHKRIEEEQARAAEKAEQVAEAAAEVAAAVGDAPKPRGRRGANGKKGIKAVAEALGGAARTHTS